MDRAPHSSQPANAFLPPGDKPVENLVRDTAQCEKLLMIWHCLPVHGRIAP